MQKFEVGKKYNGYEKNIHQCTKKAGDSVWFDGNQYKLNTDSRGNEYTTGVYGIADIKACLPVECGNQDAAVEKDMQKLYVVCVNAYWVRDTRVFDADALGSDTDDRCLSDEEYEDSWFDVKAPLFVGVTRAHNCEEACRAVAENNTEYPFRCLCAFPINERKEDSVCSR